MGIEAIVDGVLYRIGESVACENLSWVPEGTPGFDPQNAFLFVAGDEAVFVDTGPALVAPAVEEALERLAGGLRVSVFPTRNEAECIGNLGLVLTRGHGARLLFGGGGGILEWVIDPEAPPLEPSNLLGRVPIVPVSNGTTLELASLRFEWLDAPLKQMFLTQWAYESSTRTVFTSDAFSFVHQDAPQDPAVVRAVGDLDPQRLADEIACRVNWLPGAHCPDVEAALEGFFATHDVEAICPDHGCAIVGSEAVQASVAAVLEALRLVTV